MMTLIRKSNRIENIQMQDMEYTTTISWAMATYMDDIGKQLGNKVQMDFAPFQFVDLIGI